MRRWLLFAVTAALAIGALARSSRGVRIRGDFFVDEA
jgi:hypothetical protein